MSVKIFPESPAGQEMILEVVRNARKQKYTPEMLCELQKIIETKYYYWWLMDLKKEEGALELFSEDFKYYCNDYLVTDQKKTQALTSKWVNSFMVTMHMGHQPLLWLIDADHARGVFQYEDHHVYKDDKSIVETRMVYCDDFVRDDDGIWHIQTLRMYQKQTDGRYKNPFPPEGWVPEHWEE